MAQTQTALAEHQAALAVSEEARYRFEVIIGELRRDKFSAKSEKLNPQQHNLLLEDMEIAQGVLHAAQERRLTPSSRADRPTALHPATAIAANFPPICHGWNASSSRRVSFAPAAAVR